MGENKFENKGSHQKKETPQLFSAQLPQDSAPNGSAIQCLAASGLAPQGSAFSAQPLQDSAPQGSAFQFSVPQD